jgi:DNA-binding NarL/FixJ family response regulator
VRCARRSESYRTPETHTRVISCCWRVISHSLLVADSDPAILAQLSTLLARADRTIETASDGAGALARLRTSPWDAVFAGQGRGIPLLRKIRALQPDARVFVIGEGDPPHVLEAIRNHAYAYLRKPLTAGPVSDLVQQALESRFWKDDLRVVSARPEWITVEVRCKLEAAERTSYFLREIQSDLPAAFRDDVCAAFRELLMNAVEHGGKSDPRKRVRVSLLRSSRSLIVHIDDPGTGFSLASLPHAAISNPADSPTRHVEVREEAGQRPGGFGILMTRSLVDELLYNERGNSVLFVKYFS